MLLYVTTLISAYSLSSFICLYNYLYFSRTGTAKAYEPNQEPLSVIYNSRSVHYILMALNKSCAKSTFLFFHKYIYFYISIFSLIIG